jgi:hypothetical protein
MVIDMQRSDRAQTSNTRAAPERTRPYEVISTSQAKLVGLQKAPHYCHAMPVAVMKPTGSDECCPRS